VVAPQGYTENMKKITVAILMLTIFFILTGCTTKEDKSRPENVIVSNLDVPSLTLHTEGNKILNNRGQEVRLTGVNICSLEWNSRGDNVLASTYEVFANWNCNIARLPLSQDRWFGRISDWSTPNPSDGGAQYRKIVDDVVKLAVSFGKYIELDLHWSNAGEWGKNIGQHSMPDENSLEFWIDVAKKYANNSAVLFNLYNEPRDITWEVWKNGGVITEVENRGKDNEKRLTYTTPGHQKILNEIRALGANNVIIAGGLDWAYDLRGIAGAFALEDTSAGNGIIYDSHIYPWKEWDGRNHDTKVLIIANKYPVVIGEIGLDLEGEWGAISRPFWLKSMLDWMDTNKLNWTGWCFHTSATPNMISDWQFTPTRHHGAVLKERMLSYPNTNSHLRVMPRKL
jgi:hypothetical protein